MISFLHIFATCTNTKDIKKSKSCRTPPSLISLVSSRKCTDLNSPSGPCDKDEHGAAAGDLWSPDPLQFGALFRQTCEEEAKYPPWGCEDQLRCLLCAKSSSCLQQFAHWERASTSASHIRHIRK